MKTVCAILILLFIAGAAFGQTKREVCKYAPLPEPHREAVAYYEMMLTTISYGEDFGPINMGLDLCIIYIIDPFIEDAICSSWRSVGITGKTSEWTDYMCIFTYGKPEG